MLLALALVELLVQPFAAFLDADLALNYFGADGILLPVDRPDACSSASSSGLYPAFFLSRFQPAQVLKANRSAAETPGSGPAAHGAGRRRSSRSRSASSSAPRSIYGQTVYARTVDPGFKRDHILQVDELGRAPAVGRGRR